MNSIYGSKDIFHIFFKVKVSSLNRVKTITITNIIEVTNPIYPGMLHLVTPFDFLVSNFKTQNH